MQQLMAIWEHYGPTLARPADPLSRVCQLGRKARRLARRTPDKKRVFKGERKRILQKRTSDAGMSMKTKARRGKFADEAGML
jgi:hypothetical protein